MTRGLLTLIAALFMAVPAVADGGTVSLTIANDTASPLRCVVVLAHFITRDVGPLAVGEAATLELARDDASGTLAYGTHNDAPMWVENLLCGDAGRWQETRNDVPLLLLRRDPATAFRLSCGGDKALVCTLTAE